MDTASAATATHALEASAIAPTSAPTSTPTGTPTSTPISTQATFCAANLSALPPSDRAVWEEIKLRFRVVYDEHQAMVKRCIEPTRLLTLPLSGDADAGGKVARFLGCPLKGRSQASMGLPHTTGANRVAAARLSRAGQAKVG